MALTRRNNAGRDCLDRRRDIPDDAGGQLEGKRILFLLVGFEIDGNRSTYVAAIPVKYCLLYSTLQLLRRRGHHLRASRAII
jgi:hypothetical protein